MWSTYIIHYCGIIFLNCNWWIQKSPSKKNDLKPDLKEPFYANIQSTAGEFVDTAQGSKVETDRNHEEMKHIVESPFTMEHNMAYSTTTTTTTTTHT